MVSPASSSPSGSTAASAIREPDHSDRPPVASTSALDCEHGLANGGDSGGSSPEYGNPNSTSQQHWLKVQRHASSIEGGEDTHDVSRGHHGGYKEGRKSGGMKQVISNVMHAAANSHLNILRRSQGDAGLQDCEPTMVGSPPQSQRAGRLAPFLPAVFAPSNNCPRQK